MVPSNLTPAVPCGSAGISGGKRRLGGCSERLCRDRDQCPSLPKRPSFSFSPVWLPRERGRAGAALLGCSPRGRRASAQPRVCPSRACGSPQPGQEPGERARRGAKGRALPAAAAAPPARVKDALRSRPPPPPAASPQAPRARSFNHITLLMEFGRNNSVSGSTRQAAIHILLQLLFKNNRVSWLQGNYGSQCKRSSKPDIYRRDRIDLSCDIF